MVSGWSWLSGNRSKKYRDIQAKKNRNNDTIVVFIVELSLIKMANPTQPLFKPEAHDNHNIYLHSTF